MSKCELCNIQIPHYREVMGGMKLSFRDIEYTHDILFAIVHQHRIYHTPEGDYKMLVKESDSILQYEELNYCPKCGRKINKGGD